MSISRYEYSTIHKSNKIILIISLIIFSFYYKGTFLVTQAAAAAMVDSKLPHSSIINIASIAGKIGNIVI